MKWLFFHTTNIQQNSESAKQINIINTKVKCVKTLARNEKSSYICGVKNAQKEKAYHPHGQ